MKTQTIILAATLSVLTFSCHKSDNDDIVVDNFSRNGANFYYAAIPDKYNSGCDEATSFNRLSESGLAGELFICSNDSHLDKTLIIKTESTEYTFEIPHCPSNFALNGEIDGKVNPNESLTDKNGKKYTEYRFKDMPFDLDCPIDLTTGNIMCFDGEKMILEVKVGE